MWGQEANTVYPKGFMRIIPTRVGTRLCGVPHSGAVRDHPHACGDKTSAVPSGTLLSGSSPRVWGQVRNSRFSAGNFRIIPTRVGTSSSNSFNSSSVGDHPHACGDKLSVIFILRAGMGSSPRVWGQVTCMAKWHKVPRIIPTRVGTRSFNRQIGLR